jgi:hypothetical protein
MIVLFPQVKSDQKYNQGGCWNNLEYMDGAYNAYTNQGIQMKALKGMIDRLTEAYKEEYEIPKEGAEYKEKKDLYKKNNLAKISGGFTRWSFELARNVYFILTHPRRANFWIEILF